MSTPTGPQRATFQAIFDHDQTCSQILVADLTRPRALKLRPLDADTLRLAARDRHVGAVFDQMVDVLRRRGHRVLRVPAGPEMEQAAACTLDALTYDNCHVVLNGALIGARTWARPDALVRVDASDPGAGWVPLLVKTGHGLEQRKRAQRCLIGDPDDPALSAAIEVDVPGVPKRQHSIQLAHHNLLLEEMGIPGPSMGGVLDSQNRIVWRHVDDLRYRDATRSRTSARALYTKMLTGFLETSARIRADFNAGIVASLDPQHCDGCETCGWRDECGRILLDNDDLTLLHGVSAPIAAAHRANGVKSRSALACLDVDLAEILDERVEPPRASLARHPITAKYLCATASGGYRAPVRNTDGTGLRASIDRARVAVAGTVHRARDLTELSLPPVGTHGEVFLDVETTRHKRVFLTALHHLPAAGGAETVVIEDWGDPASASEPLVVRIWAQLDEWQRDSAGDLIVWHYTGYDAKALAAAAAADWPGHLTEVETRISTQFRDLHKLISEELVFPTKSWGLKHVATHLGFTWTDPESIDGELAMWLYDKATDPALSAQERAAIQQRLVAYNRDDVLGLAHVRLHLAANPPPPVETLDARYLTPV